MKNAQRGLSIDQHKEWGVALKKARGLMLSLSVDMANSLGKKKPEVRAIDIALKKIDKVRCLLDAQFCREHPQEDHRNVYYGPDVGRNTPNEGSMK